MKQVAASAAVVPGAGQEPFAAQLARFFPSAVPVRVAVNVSRESSSEAEESERSVIEFGTSREIIFLTSQALEFGERILVETADAKFQAHAIVVAMQWQPTHEGGRTVVAARFLHDVENWVVQA